MEKRAFEKLGIQTSLLGFGCMRFPLTADQKIDEAEAENMIDRAIAAGVNYIDTAYPYHNGDSEPFVGRVLEKYDRDSYYLATKLPIWKLDTLEDAKKVFEEQMERLHKDYVDFYLLHALDRAKFEKVKALGIVPYLEEMRAAGKIRYLGFSFHDDYEVFEEILNYYPWDFCQIQLNYMDTEIQAGLKGYHLAEEKGIPVIVMEPVKGGMLASLPTEIEEQLTKEREQASIASWALRFVGTLPNVKVILSGMSTMGQVEDNLSIFETFEPLSEKEQKLIENTADTLKSRVKNGCTGCAYCMPCPAGVDIPGNFRIWNDQAVYQNTEQTKKKWSGMDEKAKADHCIRCGKCENTGFRSSTRTNVSDAENVRKSVRRKFQFGKICIR